MGLVEGKLPISSPSLQFSQTKGILVPAGFAKKRKAPGKTGGLALMSLEGDPLRRYIELRDINKVPARNASIIYR
jgi:hypothetical protein